MVTAGTYTTEITDVTASGLTWDGITPSNSFEKLSSSTRNRNSSSSSGNRNSSLTR